MFPSCQEKCIRHKCGCIINLCNILRFVYECPVFFLFFPNRSNFVWQQKNCCTATFTSQNTKKPQKSQSHLGTPSKWKKDTIWRLPPPCSGAANKPGKAPAVLQNEYTANGGPAVNYWAWHHRDVYKLPDTNWAKGKTCSDIEVSNFLFNFFVYLIYNVIILCCWKKEEIISKL